MRFITLTLLIASSLSYAQTSILYEISGKGLEQNSYLFGTLHVQNEEAFNFNDSVFWAINQCETAAFELDFNLRSNNFNFENTKLKGLAEHLATELIPAIMDAIPPDTMAYKIINKLVPLYKYILSSVWRQ